MKRVLIRDNWHWQIVLCLALIAFNAIGVMAQDGYISARSFAESQGIAHQWFPIQKILVMRQDFF